MVPVIEPAFDWVPDWLPTPVALDDGVPVCEPVPLRLPVLEPVPLALSVPV